MKKLLFAAAALALTAGSALAADLPSHKGPPMLPPPPPPPMWTGFYVGLNAGYTWSNSNTIDTLAFNFQRTPNLAFGPVSAALATGALPASADGFIGGGQIGYNWQFAGRFVAGIEADIQGIAGSNTSSARSAASINIAGGGWDILHTGTASRSLDYLGTVRGRLGWLFTPSLLVYGTGGLAYGGVNVASSILQLVPQQPPPYFSAGGFSDTRVGWTAGGGLEWMFWPNWSAKIEYLYYDLGNVTFSQSPLINVGAIAGVVWYSSAVQNSTRFDGHIVRAGLNYHFNFGAAPVVAKY